MPLIFTARLKEERDYYEELANYWLERANYWAKKCNEIFELAERSSDMLREYSELGPIDYIRKLVEKDKALKNQI